MLARKFVLAGSAAFAALCLTPPVNATTSVGGYTFADNAFADQVTGSSGNYWVMNAATLPAAVTGSDTNSFVRNLGGSAAYIDFAFTDNAIVNGAGADLVLFELGSPDLFTITLNGMTRSAQSLATGFSSAGYSLNAAAIDLDVFGLASGATVNQLRLTFTDQPGSNAAVAAIGALNSTTSAVPETKTWGMFLAGFGILGAILRRRRKSETSIA